MASIDRTVNRCKTRIGKASIDRTVNRCKTRIGKASIDRHLNIDEIKVLNM
jgi:hypothetical protein